MFHNVEFRDGQYYDFVVTNPAILTVEVGAKNPPQNEILQNEQYVNPNELDSLMKKFSSELDSFKKQQSFGVSSPMNQPSFGASPSQTLQLSPHQQVPHQQVPHQQVPHQQVPHSYKTVESTPVSMEDVEREKNKLIEQIYEAMQYFLSYVQTQAKQYAGSLSNEIKDDTFDPTPKSKLIEILSSSSFDEPDWRRKLSEIQSTVKLTEVKDREYELKLTNDIERQPETTVDTHLAAALNKALTQYKENLLQDIKLIYTTQQHQTTLIEKLISSYQTFYSWILDQWNRCMREIHTTYESVHRKITKLWSEDPIHKDILQLLKRYESFLTAHASSLPLEFKLSENPRKEWKEYLAKQQPEECIRLMKNELRALSDIPALKTSIQVWENELSYYDVDKIHKMNENRNRMRKRIEDAVDVETKQTCQKRWRELNDQIYHLGTDLQKKASHKFDEYNKEYTRQQQIILSHTNLLQRDIRNYESRLALSNQPWATWMEKRKLLIKEWAAYNYLQVSISSLLTVHEQIVYFKRFIETQQEQKL
jgi:hypothetical protein